MDIVGSRYVVNGLALNQFAQRLMGVFGGLMGGVLLAFLGIGGTLLVMAGGYATALVILFFTRTASRPGFGTPEQPSVRQSFGEALSLAGRNPSVRALLLLSVATEIFAFSHTVMIAIFARDVLEIGEQGFGIMVAARAVGSVVGVAVLASIGDRLPKGKSLLVASALFGLSLAAFGSQPWLVTALFFLGVAGMMASIFDLFQQAALQLAVGGDQRGRAMGIWVMGVGAGPVGHLEVGSLSDFTKPAVRHHLQRPHADRRRHPSHHDNPPPPPDLTTTPVIIESPPVPPLTRESKNHDHSQRPAPRIPTVCTTPSCPSPTPSPR